MHERRKLAVVCLPRDLDPSPYDAFAVRHREIVSALSRHWEITVVWLSDDNDQIPDVPGVHATVRASWTRLAEDRWSRLARAARWALRIPTRRERELRDILRSAGAPVAVTLGPWLQNEYRIVWASGPSLHFFEEDLTRMPELAPQSRRARVLRRFEWRLYRLSGAHPRTVIAISPIEAEAAKTYFPRSSIVYAGLTLDPEIWPKAKTVSTGDGIIAVGNFSEARNAEGLADVLRQLSRPPASMPSLIRVVSGPGLHASLAPWVTSGALRHEPASASLSANYRRASVALVPARRLSGQKTTILQAWTCGVPVVTTVESAATVDSPEAVAIGRDATELADALRQLLTDETRRWSLAVEGFATINRKFDRKTQESELARLIDELYRGRPA